MWVTRAFPASLRSTTTGGAWGLLQGLNTLPLALRGAPYSNLNGLGGSINKNYGMLNGPGCGCTSGPRCGCSTPRRVPPARIRARQLGYLGASNQLTATVSGASTGAKAGSFFGPIGTVVGGVVGAVVGFLSTKLFGHANHAQIAQDVATRLTYAEAYKQIAGQYPGRNYGKDDLLQVWKGLIHEDVFPKNWGGGTCNVQACIQAGAAGTAGQCANCGGVEQWADDMFNGQLANPKTQGFQGAAQTAVQLGLSPIQAADQIMIPAWAPPDGGKFNIKWASPQNSTNPALVRQLFIDTLDTFMSTINPNLPVYYGTLQTNTPVAQAAPAVTPAGPAVQSGFMPTPSGGVTPIVTAGPSGGPVQSYTVVSPPAFTNPAQSLAPIPSAMCPSGFQLGANGVTCVAIGSGGGPAQAIIPATTSQVPSNYLPAGNTPSGLIILAPGGVYNGTNGLVMGPAGTLVPYTGPVSQSSIQVGAPAVAGAPATITGSGAPAYSFSGDTGTPTMAPPAVQPQAASGSSWLPLAIAAGGAALMFAS